MTNWKKIAGGILALLIIIAIYQGFFKETQPSFDLVEVSQGEIIQEVSETGQVKKGEEISLGFKNAGRIENIYIEVGEEVRKGTALARLETSDLTIQLQEANAVLSLAQAKLNKLLAGATKEETQKAETTVFNAQISLKDAKLNLQDVKSQAGDDLDAAYEDALNVLEDAYLKAYNVQNSVDLIQRTYFTQNDQEGFGVRENEEKIIQAVSQIKSSLEATKTDSSEENIDKSFSQTKEGLSKLSGALKAIREYCQSSSYHVVVSSTDKTSLDTHREYINTALTNVTNAQQTISSTELANEADINTAQAKVSAAEGVLAVAEDELNLITAPAQKEDINLYQAEIDQAQAQVKALENQLSEATLRSPVEAQVVEVKKREGETVQPMLQDSAVVLLPKAAYEIEVDIYEEDIVKIDVGNPVEISLVAFPDEVFKGEVISINPAEKIVEGVVYYEVNIAFGEIPAGVKPGMTADLEIRTATKENVLVVPEDVLQEKNGKIIVEILEGEKIEEKEIEVGLKGSNDMVEILSGLSEGEEVILR